MPLVHDHSLFASSAIDLAFPATLLMMHAYVICFQAREGSSPCPSTVNHAGAYPSWGAQCVHLAARCFAAGCHSKRAAAVIFSTHVRRCGRARHRAPAAHCGTRAKRKRGIAAYVAQHDTAGRNANRPPLRVNTCTRVLGCTARLEPFVCAVRWSGVELESGGAAHSSGAECAVAAHVVRSRAQCCWMRQ